MRLIKKQDQCDTTYVAFECAHDMDVQAEPEAPAWMELANARRKADRSDPPDKEQIEQRAFENGYRQGEKAGLEAAEKRLDSLMKRYANAIREISSLKPALYAQAEREVVKLALEVAKKIVRREVRVDPEIIQTLVKVALQHVAVKSPVTIRLHPADHEYLLQLQTSSSTREGSEREAVYLADKSIERGGCLIETDCGDVDARIDEEFREVERSFLNSED